MNCLWGIAVQKGGFADGPDFAVAEKPAQWDGAQLFLKEIGIMVGFAIKVFAAPETGEQ